MAAIVNNTSRLVNNTSKKVSYNYIVVVSQGRQYFSLSPAENELDNAEGTLASGVSE